MRRKYTSTCEVPSAYLSFKARADLFIHIAKIRLLDNLLKEIRKTSNDRVVIVSNYTQTLEVLCRLCKLR